MTPKTGRKFTGLYFQIIITLFVLLASLSVTLNAQSVAEPSLPDGEWMRIATDDGSFSVEIPKEYRMFYDAEGFLVSTDFHSFKLKNAFVLSSYNKGTVIGVEVFDGDSGAIREMYSSDRGSWGLKKAPDIKGKRYTIRQLRQASDKYYALRQYIHINGKGVILTAASRKGETDEMKRFFNSVSIDLDGNGSGRSSVLLSKLQRTSVPITVDLNDEPGKPNTNTQKNSDTSLMTVVVVAPRPTYVNSARKNMVTGVVRLRIRMAKDGFVSAVSINKTLPDGLLRQTLFSAIRTRFIPYEQNGETKDAYRSVEYSFSIY